MFLAPSLPDLYFYVSVFQAYLCVEIIFGHVYSVLRGHFFFILNLEIRNKGMRLYMLGVICKVPKRAKCFPSLELERVISFHFLIFFVRCFRASILTIQVACKNTSHALEHVRALSSVQNAGRSTLSLILLSCKRIDGSIIWHLRLLKKKKVSYITPYI